MIAHSHPAADVEKRLPVCAIDSVNHALPLSFPINLSLHIHARIYTATEPHLGPLLTVAVSLNVTIIFSRLHND
jgi:hypothetical protein